MTSAASPPMTITCFTVRSSAFALSTSSSSGAATISAVASVVLATCASSVRDSNGEVGTITPPILIVANTETSAGGIDGARRSTRSSSPMPSPCRLEPSRLTEACSAR